MIAFIEKQTRLVIGTNYKVMFSFFATHPQFTPGEASGAVDFLLVRHPYDRVVDLFYDKCRKAVGPDFPVFQTCQKIICNAAGFEERAQLLSLSFPDFCALLPRIATADDHFQPQTFGIEDSVFKQVIRIEHELPILSAVLDVDLSTKVNHTPHPIWQEVVTPDTASVLGRVYAEDFERLGYSMVAPSPNAEAVTL